MPEENLHITVKFLGEVRDEQLSKLQASLSAIPPVALRLRSERVGFFPPRGGPRVFVVHLTGDAERLVTLHQSVEAAMEPLGFPRENRSFKPHVTLARARARFGAPASIKPPILANPELPGELFTVEALTLFRSDLRREGAVYSAVERFALT